jgi:hypothetical protein
VQLDLYTHIILSVLSVYQSANRSIYNNDTPWKLKIKTVSVVGLLKYPTPECILFLIGSFPTVGRMS